MVYILGKNIVAERVPGDKNAGCSGKRWLPEFPYTTLLGLLIPFYQSAAVFSLLTFGELLLLISTA